MFIFENCSTNINSKIYIMKKLQLLFSLLCFIPSTFAQDFLKEPNFIQRFIESTVQIPFMARVVQIKGSVSIRVTTDETGLPIKYEVVESLREDCDKEALRVIKLLNNKLLLSSMNGKKEITLNVPFRSFRRINFSKGSINQYYDSNQKITLKKEDYRYVSKHLVDTLTGIIRSNVAYLDLKSDIPENEIKLALLQIDSSGYHPREIFEEDNNSYKHYIFKTKLVENFPIIEDNRYLNGLLVEDIHVIPKPQTSINIFGNCSYFPNGRIQKERLGLSIEDKFIYIHYNWFANGQIKSIETYEHLKSSSIHKIISVWDTLGTQVVKDGKGNGVFYYEYGKNIEVVSGNIEDGMKEGKWVGKNSVGKIIYTENMEHNKFVNGISYVDNVEIPYTTIEQPAEYNGGITKFAQDLRRHLKYPIQAQKARIEGKVYVQFAVYPDGELRDYKVIKGIGYGCDEEAIRVLQVLNGNWIAGKQRGKAVVRTFTVPITYQL